jgi:hypothetical protein
MVLTEVEGVVETDEMEDTEELDVLDVARLGEVDDEVDDAMIGVLDKDEVEDTDDDNDDETVVESIAQTLTLQLPPHNCVLSPPHLEEQSVSGTLALFETAFNSFPQ